jgi:hypothetical protein
MLNAKIYYICRESVQFQEENAVLQIIMELWGNSEGDYFK